MSVHVDGVANAVVRAAERQGNVAERCLIEREYLANGELVALVSKLSGVPRSALALPAWLVHAGAAVAETLSRVMGTPPVLGLSPETAWHWRLSYRPLPEALREDLATFFQ